MVYLQWGRFDHEEGDNMTKAETSRGGATVLKVGGDNFASGASQKIFLDPPLFDQWGTKYCLDSYIYINLGD